MTNSANTTLAPGRPLVGVLLIVAALQLLPVSDVMAKYSSQFLPVLQVIWARFFFHCILTGAYCGSSYGLSCLMPRPTSVLFMRGAALFAAVGLFYVTIHYLPLTTTLTLWFVEPFILTIMAVVFFKERVSAWGWLAVAVGFCGVILANPPELIDFHWAYLTGLAAGVGYAIFLLLTRLIDEDSPPIVSVFHTGLVGCILSTLVVPAVWQWPAPSEWVLLVLIGLIAAIAHLLIVWAFANANASTLAPFTYSEIIAATFLGMAVFGNVPNGWTIAGLLVITISGVIITLQKQPKS